MITRIKAKKKKLVTVAGDQAHSRGRRRNLPSRQMITLLKGKKRKLVIEADDHAVKREEEETCASAR